MALLRKLMIRGVRAFGPRTENVIEFCTPLTLIVGPNGTGKTTVIESLKYALTGIFPPNSKGGAFVHDPKMVKEPDVRAEIRLRFKDITNRLLAVKRVLQVVEKGGKIFQKTLETELVNEGDSDHYSGERGVSHIMASKLCDVDMLIPSLIGASGAALIEYVMLCHQEENTWPVGESRVLKERLDEIFCSTQYSKALKAMKDSKRDIGNSYKVLEERLKSLGREKLRRDEVVSKLGRITEDRESLGRRLRTLKEEKSRIQEILDNLYKDEDVYVKLEKNYRALISERDMCLNYIKTFKHEVFDVESAIKLLCNISDGERYSNMEIGSILERLKSTLDSKIESYRLIDTSILDIHNQETEKGLKEATEVLNLTQSLKYIIDKIRHIEMSILEKIKEQRELKISDLKTQEDKLKAKKRVLEKKAYIKSALIEEVMGFENKNKSILKKYIPIEKSPVYKTIDQKQIKHLKEKLSASEITSCDKKVEALELEVREKGERINAIFEKLSKSQFLVTELKNITEYIKNGEAEVERMKVLELRREELIERENTLQRNAELARNNATKKTLLISRIREDSERYKGELINVSSENNHNQFKDLKALVLSLINNCTKLSNKTTSDNLQEILECVEEVEKRAVFQKVSSVESLALVKEIEDITKNIVVSTGAEAIYKNFKHLGNTKGVCPLCKTNLEPRSMEVFNKKLTHVIMELPKKVSALCEKKEELIKKKRYLEDTNQEAERYNEFIADLRDFVSKIKDRVLELLEIKDVGGLNKITEEYEATKRQLYELNINEKTLTTLSKQIETKRMHLKGLLKRNGYSDDEKVSDLLEEEKRLRESLASLRQEQKKVDQKLELARKSYEEKRSKEALYLWLEKVQNLKEHDKEKLDKNIEDIELLLSQISNKKALYKVNKETIEGQKKDVTALKEDAKLRLTALKERIERVNKLCAGLNDLLKEYKSVEIPLIDKTKYSLERFDDDGILGFIKSLKDIQAVIQERIRSQIEKVRSIQNLKDLETTVIENIRLNNCKTRVLTIEVEFGDFDMKKKQVLAEKIELMRSKETEILAKEGMVRGELKQKQMAQKELEEELERNYSSVNKEYSLCALELKASELGVKDMEECIRALDKAIVEYHKAKLDEVNYTLCELWTSTYKGGDIETIELRSDNTDLRTCGYSIVMIKGGVVIDMRGRCSAGQKAIASLLVRIALADTFGGGCNMIALDEPTTNLDRENIKALAETLSELVRRRKEMQLIVITHDEDFVNMLGTEGLEHFYRLRRNLSGKSIIERHSVLSSDII